MPGEETIANILEVQWDDAVMKLANAANSGQIELESFAEVLDMDERGMREALASNTGAVAASLASLNKRVLRIVDQMIADAYGSGFTARQLEENAAATLYTWVTTSGNSCPDCINRSGEEHTMQEWELIGRPGSGFSVCGANCKCRLDSKDKTEYTKE